MKYYFAPLEGITGYVYRNAHHKFFPGTDRYYTPFVAPNYTKHFKTKEKRDVAAENNAGVPLVPQVLSNTGAAGLRGDQPESGLPDADSGPQEERLRPA